MVKEYMHGADVLLEEGFGPNFTVSVGIENRSSPALLTRAGVAVRGLSNIVPEPFDGLVRAVEGGLAKATELLHRRVLAFTAIYTLSGPGLGIAKLATKKLGLYLSSTVCGPALPNPPGCEEATEATGLLPAQGEA